MKKQMILLIVGMMASVAMAQTGTIDIRLSASFDDIEQYVNGGGYRDSGASTDLELGKDSSNPGSGGGDGEQYIGMRFRDVQIPAGSRITNAYVQFQVDDNASGQTNVIIYAELNANPAALVISPNYDISDRIPTPSVVNWYDIPAWPSNDAEGPDQQTPDISSVIYDVVSLPGWASGNAILVIIVDDPDETSTGHRTAESVDGEASAAPLLHVEYAPDNVAKLVSPIDWALVDVGLLEWLRPEAPSGDPGTILVNVYFGTDPNLIPGLYGTLEIEHNYDGDSTTDIPATLDANQEYSWRVDVIDPNFGNPTTYEGLTWTFVTTVPAEIILSKTALDVSEEGPTSDIYNISLTRAPAQPVTVTPGDFPTVFELRILAGGDDVEERQSDGNISRSSSDLEMPWDGGTLQIIGLWWDNIGIPPGATITSASVDFQADNGSTGDVYLTVSGRLDDPGTFQQDINWMVSTPTITDDETTAEVEWTPGPWVDNDRYLTPDLTTIIQEIVDGPLWSFGRGLAITIRDGNSGGTTAQGSWRHAESFTGSNSSGTRDQRAVLRIEYAAGTGSFPVSWSPPSVTLDAGNYLAGLDITVTAVDDTISETDPHFFTLPNVVSSADAEWDAVTANDVVVTIAENDCGAWGFVPLLDINQDCVVDLGDLAEFASQFGVCTDPDDRITCIDVR